MCGTKGCKELNSHVSCGMHTAHGSGEMEYCMRLQGGRNDSGQKMHETVDPWDELRNISSMQRE